MSDSTPPKDAVFNEQPLLRLVLATLPVGVAVVDRAGDIVLVNAASKRIWSDTIFSGRERWAQSKGFGTTRARGSPRQSGPPCVRSTKARPA